MNSMIVLGIATVMVLVLIAQTGLKRLNRQIDQVHEDPENAEAHAMRAKRIFVLTVAATALFVLFGATAVKDDALGTWVQPVEKPEYQPHPMMRDRSEW